MKKSLTALLLPIVSTNLLAAQIAEKKPYNILCIVCEDISPFLGCYGDKVALTPNLDKFATEAVLYNRMYCTVGVSAPSRAALITGMYPSAIGANQHRVLGDPLTSAGNFPAGVLPYEVVLPEGVKCFTEYLRAAGYYCTNNSKTDYQFNPPQTAWDVNGGTAHWKNRPTYKPFFSVVNLGITHESQIWLRTNLPLVVDPSKIVLPPYYPEDPIVRHDMAVLYSNINEMDKQAQALIDEVKNAGLLDNTIIIFYSDNGGPMPRGKRALYESGTHVPFMIRYPDGYRKGEVENRLCSFVDIPASILSLAGIQPPTYMHGQTFLGTYDTPVRDYVFGARNRFDEVIDKMGSVRDAKFRYIRNYMPEIANYLNNSYRLQIPTMQRMIELLNSGGLNDVQKLWFKKPRPIEEFYDVETDPHEVDNQINNPAYAADIARLRNAYNTWDDNYNALWKKTELECREMFWPGGTQLTAVKPVMNETTQGVVLSSTTPGVSFAYQINGKGLSTGHWYLYTKPIAVVKGDVVTSSAVRAGYLKSAITSYKALSTTPPTEISTVKDSNAPIVKLLNRKLMISNVTDKIFVRIYSTVGQLIVNKKAASSTIEIPLTLNGVFTVVIQNGVKRYVRKVIIK
jgi:arylsulfatase A-like enzyme